MSQSAYSNWDRKAATERALKTADDNSKSSTTDGYIYNFAFGSNLNPNKVKSRKMSPTQTLRGKLPNWQLLFNHNGGYGNIEQTEIAQNLDVSRLSNNKKGTPQPNEVHGVVLKLSRTEFAQMAWEEYAYNSILVPITIYPEDVPSVDASIRKGEAPHIIHAIAFKTHPCAITTPTTLPSKRYIQLIQDGAKQSGIQQSYCDWLSQIPSS